MMENILFQVVLLAFVSFKLNYSDIFKQSRAKSQQLQWNSEDAMLNFRGGRVIFFFFK